MKIKIGHYTLRSDQYSYWIEEEYMGEDAKKRPKMQTRRVAGYANSLKNLLCQFVDYKVMASDAEDMAELEECIQKIHDDVVMLKEAALDYGFTFERVKGKDSKEGDSF